MPGHGTQLLGLGAVGENAKQTRATTEPSPPTVKTQTHTCTPRTQLLGALLAGLYKPSAFVNYCLPLFNIRACLQHLIHARYDISWKSRFLGFLVDVLFDYVVDRDIISRNPIML